MGLQHGLHDVECPTPIEICALLSHHAEPGISIHDAMKTARSIPRIVVSDQSEELDIPAVLSDLSYKILADLLRAGVVIGDDLRNRGLSGIDLAIHREDRHAR